MGGWIFLSAIGLLLAYGIALFNGLVRLRNRFLNAFSQIDVQLKRRHDLIPNLVEIAKGYIEHESSTLEAVVEARARAVQPLHAAASRPGDPDAMKQLNQSEQALSGALGKLLAVAEAYPELKANETMSQLSEALTSTENRIAFARQAYNDAVMKFNTAREVFPGSLVASSFQFGPAELLASTRPGEAETPKVQLS